MGKRRLLSDAGELVAFSFAHSLSTVAAWSQMKSIFPNAVEVPQTSNSLCQACEKEKEDEDQDRNFLKSEAKNEKEILGFLTAGNRPTIAQLTDGIVINLCIPVYRI